MWLFSGLMLGLSICLGHILPHMAVYAMFKNVFTELWIPTESVGYDCTQRLAPVCDLTGFAFRRIKVENIQEDGFIQS